MPTLDEVRRLVKDLNDLEKAQLLRDLEDEVFVANEGLLERIRRSQSDKACGRVVSMDEVIALLQARR